MLRPLTILLVLTVLSLSGGPAEAALTVYTSRNNWQTDIETFATEPFTLTTLGPSLAGINNYGFFTATLDANDSGYTGIVEPGAVNGTREFQARISTDAPNDPSLIDVNLAGPVLGIGADFVGTTDGDSLTITIGSETVQFDQHLPGNGDGFLGVISTTLFSSLKLATEVPTFTGEAFAVDNISFGPLAAADFDLDIDVDAVDLAKWETGLGTAIGANRDDGDADDDNDVDGFDFMIWQQQHGFGVPAPLAAATTVPEPAAGLLWIIATIAILRTRNSGANYRPS